MKPYSVWVKQQGEWSLCFETHNPTDAREYAVDHIHFGRPIERIEIRDLTGVLETVWDGSWS
jgi:phosphoglycolate phosphatase-like HAD superfamily hydrolase